MEDFYINEHINAILTRLDKIISILEQIKTELTPSNQSPEEKFAEVQKVTESLIEWLNKKAKEKEINIESKW